MDIQAQLNDGDSDIDEYLPEGLESDISEVFSEEEELERSESEVENFDIDSPEPNTTDDDSSREENITVEPAADQEETITDDFKDDKVVAGPSGAVTASFLSVPEDFNVSSEEPQAGKGKKRKRKKLDKKDVGTKGGKRKRTKNVQGGEAGKGKKRRKASNKRRNIKKFLTQDQLGADTLAAQHEEEERKKRLELHKQNLISSTIGPPPLLPPPLLGQPMPQTSLESLSSHGGSFEPPPPSIAASTAPSVGQKPTVHECIVLDSSSSGSDGEGKTAENHVIRPHVKDLIEILSSDDEAGSARSDDEPEDMDNSGTHTNDALNLPDRLGRVQVNVGHPPDEPDIFLAPQMARAVKPHQVGGIRFLYDNLVESLGRFKQSSGFGCILAHSMGLGKTLQMIAFIETFFRHSGAQRALCIVPINTLQNWLAEFNLWIPPPPSPSPSGDPPQKDPNKTYRHFGLFVLNDTHRTTVARAAVIKEWYNKGGVILIGYEMYRLLSQKKSKGKSKSKKTKDSQSELIDLEECEKKNLAHEEIYQALVKPGPDLIVCDEGHRIKNSYASISQALKSIVTRRRVVLTGYPLQNNLLEYWCMVDFVRPNFLGNKTEFCNLFERPIVNGQCMDSTFKDRKLMQYRSHVLHSLLRGFVQRRSHSVLATALPPKQEHVLLVHLTTLQKLLYHKFMKYFVETTATGLYSSNPIKAFSVCCKIWNHSDILHEVMQQKNEGEEETDLDLPEVQKLNGKDQASSSSSKSIARVKESSASSDRSSPKVIHYDWAKDVMSRYIPHQLHNSNKMVLLMYLLDNAIKAGDKMLVFSQSLTTLSVIEYFLSKREIPFPPELGNSVCRTWVKNKTYYRLDGSTSTSEREKMINNFNIPQSSIQLFLLSTRAGCLGINLVGANRVVIFDASWNPCHDAQAVCRVYRYGQTKPCRIYRLVSNNTLEKKIYDRQISKQGMSNRIVDELNPMANFTKKEVESLLEYNEEDMPYEDFGHLASQYQDAELQNICLNYSQCIAKEPFSHESLLLDMKGMRLSSAEKKQAKQGYEAEKKMNVTYSRQSYSAYYAKASSSTASVGLPPPVAAANQIGQQQPFLHNGVPLVSNLHRNLSLGRPIASVRPIQNTPMPMTSQPTLNSPPELHQKLLNLKQAGVTVQRIITTTDITLPGTRTSTTTNSITIKAGEPINMIRTQKGTYIRTSAGKIYAVRSSLQNSHPSPYGRPAEAGTASGLTLPPRAVPMATSAGAVSLPLFNSAAGASPLQASLAAAGPSNNAGMLGNPMVPLGNTASSNSSSANALNGLPLPTSAPISNYFAHAMTSNASGGALDMAGNNSGGALNRAGQPVLTNFLVSNSANVSQSASAAPGQPAVSGYSLNSLSGSSSQSSVGLPVQPVRPSYLANSAGSFHSSIPPLPNQQQQQPLANNVLGVMNAPSGGSMLPAMIPAMVPAATAVQGSSSSSSSFATTNQYLPANQALAVGRRAANQMVTAGDLMIAPPTSSPATALDPSSRSSPLLAPAAPVPTHPTNMLAFMSANSSSSNGLLNSGFEHAALAAAQSPLPLNNAASANSIESWSPLEGGSLQASTSNSPNLSWASSNDRDTPLLPVDPGAAVLHTDFSRKALFTHSFVNSALVGGNGQGASPLGLTTNPPSTSSSTTSAATSNQQVPPDFSQTLFEDTDGDNLCSENNAAAAFGWN